MDVKLVEGPVVIRTSEDEAVTIAQALDVARRIAVEAGDTTFEADTQAALTEIEAEAISGQLTLPQLVSDYMENL